MKPIGIDHTLASSTAWGDHFFICCKEILFYSSPSTVHNCSVVFGFIALERSPRIFQTFSIGFSSGLWVGQSITMAFSSLKKLMTCILVTGGIVLHEHIWLIGWISRYRQNMSFTLQWQRTNGRIHSADIIPQTMTLSPSNLTVILIHVGDNFSPTPRRTYLLLSDRNKLNFYSPLKCTVCHFSSDHVTRWVSKQDDFFCSWNWSMAWLQAFFHVNHVQPIYEIQFTETNSSSL